MTACAISTGFVEVVRRQKSRMSSAYSSFAQESQKVLVEGCAQARQGIGRAPVRPLLKKSIE
jgi:hypothetical protein